MLSLKSKLKYAGSFALSFAILTAMSFLAGLFVSIQIAPSPVATALYDLVGFAPVMTVGALVVGFAQTFLTLWLHTHRPQWFWAVNLIIAILLGGIASFFSFWIIWVLVGLANFLLNLLVLRFLELRQFKIKSA